MMIPRKKILLISPSSGRGGAESVLLEMIDVLSEKFDIYLLTHRGENRLVTHNQKAKRVYVTNLFNGALEININIFNLLLFPFGLIKNFFLTWLIIKKEKIDFVISNSSTIIYPGLAAKVCNKKTITIFHEMIGNYFLRKMFFKIIDIYCDRLIFNSKFILSLFPKSKKSEVIMIGLSKDKFNKLSVIGKKMKNNLTVGQVGKIYKTKGTDLFIQTAKEVISQGHVNFNVYGDILDRQFYFKIKDSIKDIKFSNLIKLEQYKNAELVLKEVDLVLVTSRFETFGIVILEAMAAGIPVISFNVGAANQIIKNGENGFIVDNYDTKKMADIILNIKNGNIDIIKMGENAKSTIKNNFIGSFAERLANSIMKY